MASRAPAEPTRAGPESVPASTPSRHRESPRIRTALKVSSPGDSAEREAESVARKVVAMRGPAGRLSIAARSPLMPARVPVVPVTRISAPNPDSSAPPRARPPDETSPELDSAIKGQLGGGRPLPADVAEFMEPRFKASFANVRIHTDARAANLATRLGARAFTFGRDIFFNEGQFQPDGSEGMELIAHELTHTIQQREIVQREAIPFAPVQVHETASPHVQRGIVSRALDWVADKANNIPGFRLFTIVIGVNPVNMSRVDRSGANILRAMIEFIPGGHLIVEALENHGVFQKGGKFIEDQFRALGMVGSAFRDALMEFIDSLGWRDIFHLGSLWSRAKRIFTDPIDKLIDFGKGLIVGIATIVKDAILKPLAKWAAGKIPYWKLLVGVFGERGDPISGEKESPAEALIGGFMELIGQKEIWENIKKGNAVGKAWNWFKNALKGAFQLVVSIPGRVMATIRSLTIWDIVTLVGAFEKIVGAFASFVKDFAKWALGTVLDLLEIIFIVVAPEAVQHLKKAKGAFATIIKAPGRFIGYLVAAGRLGFNLFVKNFVTHLTKALFKWLLGSAEGAGIYLPKGIQLVELLKFGLSVLGLTWANLRAKMVAATNETVVKALETGFDLVVTLVREGPAAAWKQLLENLSNLKSMVMDAVIDMVQAEVVRLAITKILSFLSPIGAFIEAVKAIYRTVMFIVQKLKQIAALVGAFIDGLAAIAAGTIAPAAKRVEDVLAQGMALALAFLADFAGLGNIPKKVMELIKKVRDPVDKAMDKVVEWVVNQARKVGKFIAQAGVPHDPNERLRLASRDAVAVARRLSGRVTEPLLNGALAAIRTRYGLTSIMPIRRGPSWWVRATINPTVEQDLGLPTEAPVAAGGDRWTAAVAAVREDLARMEAEGVFETDIQRAIPGWTSRLGFRTLSIQTTDDDYVIEGSMSPGRPVARVARAGSRRKPFGLDWPKPAATSYPPLYFGGVVNARRSQAALKGLWRQNALDATGTKVQKFLPTSRKALPGGGDTIGLSSSNSLRVGSIVGPICPDTTPGGGTLLSILRPYGFSATYEGLDADHVKEIQMGGQDELQNLWPLDAGVNRGAGSTLAQKSVTYPGGSKSVKLSDLKTRTGKFYFRISGVR